MKYDQNDELLNALTLGKKTQYHSDYAPELLQAVPRSLNRQELGIVEEQPFVGCDVWNAYELSWLNSKGKPVVALARLMVAADSDNIIESKSLKLYLNSFNQTRFSSFDEVRVTMIKDLSRIAGLDVEVELFTPEQYAEFTADELPGRCIDSLDIAVDHFELNPEVLSTEPAATVIDEVLHSHLLKSNCLITNQPDWASVIIAYRGVKIDQETLLRYLISFRMHNEFHEQCVERIYMDISRQCAPESLSVQALYTRRGGLDINPYRQSGSEFDVPLYRINRQ